MSAQPKIGSKALREYRRKRSFDVTPEPEPGADVDGEPDPVPDLMAALKESLARVKQI